MACWLCAFRFAIINLNMQLQDRIINRINQYFFDRCGLIRIKNFACISRLKMVNRESEWGLLNKNYRKTFVSGCHKIWSMPLIKYFKKKRNPPWYQGKKNPSQHFEGWYYKIVDQSEGHVYAIIPGVFINKTHEHSHAFIQVFDGRTGEACYHKFPITEFRASDAAFEIHIDSNYFSSNKIKLDLQNSTLQLSGELNFNDLTPWPKTLISPGIMGWYTWAPFMECYHGIVSLDHEIEGTLAINNQNVDFTSGKGYTEKDWGKSFPDAWIWCQSNHFNTENTSITGSIAIIPWIRRPFLGFIIGLWHDKKLFRFATYNGARLIEFDIDESTAQWVVEQKNLILELTAHRSEGGFLQAPTINGMINKISESLTSALEVVLKRVSPTGSTIILKDIGRHGGLEVAGNLTRLKQMFDTYKMKNN